MIYILVWAFIAYPFLFAFLLIATPQIFSLPKLGDVGAQQTWRERHKHGNRTCCGLYCGLTALYFGIIAVVIWVVFHVANSKWQQSFQIFETEDWAGNYVVVEKTSTGSTGSLFTMSGQLIGQVVFTELATQWSMGLSPPQPQSIHNVLYNVTNFGNEIGFVANCTALNGSSTACLTGGLESIPEATLYQGHRQVAEYAGNLIFNVTPEDGFHYPGLPTNGTELITWGMQYQGIGIKYPPLGSWSLNNNTALDVMWSMNSSTACAGLRVNLPKEEQLLSWPVVGLIWQWWIEWGENGGCSWE